MFRMVLGKFDEFGGILPAFGAYAQLGYFSPLVPVEAVPQLEVAPHLAQEFSGLAGLLGFVGILFQAAGSNLQQGS